MRKFYPSLLALLLLCGSASAQTMSGFPFPSSPPAQILTSGSSFTTSAGIPFYRLILIGAGGGGGSSTGAGTGGSGASGNVTICEVYGNGTVYPYSLGTGGAKGAAGATGTAGGNTAVNSDAGCTANGGPGGVNGTASAGAGGAQAGANSPAAMAAISNVRVGEGLSSFLGLAGTSGSSAQVSSFGVTGGMGCAGANCTTDTAGLGGEIIVIPEVY